MISAISNTSLNFILAGSVVCFTTYSQIAMRLSLSRIFVDKELTFDFATIFKCVTDIMLVSAVFSFFLAFVFWSAALANNINAAKFYPIVTSVTITLVWMLNIFIFNDEVNFYNFLGVGLLIAGIFLLFRM